MLSQGSMFQRVVFVKRTRSITLETVLSGTFSVILSAFILNKIKKKKLFDFYSNVNHAAVSKWRSPANYFLRKGMFPLQNNNETVGTTSVMCANVRAISIHRSNKPQTRQSGSSHLISSRELNVLSFSGNVILSEQENKFWLDQLWWNACWDALVGLKRKKKKI